jgi:hypothetical protein
MKLYTLLIGTVVALAVPAVVHATSRTTMPSQAILVNVDITDKGIRTAMFHSEGPRSTEYWAAYYALRGEVAYFVVRNRGKKPHSFAVLGKKTKPIRPGHSVRFHVVLTKRGSFPFQSTLDAGKKGFRGVFTVA